MPELAAREPEERISHRADPAFKHRVQAKSNGETLKFCYQCGTCTAACPISKFIDIYRPNKILKLAKLGIQDLPQSNAFLFCSACTLCTKGCPQGVKVHEVMQALKDVTADDPKHRAFLATGFNQTLDALAESMPFPVVYSWICLRLGEWESVGEFGMGLPSDAGESGEKEKTGEVGAGAGSGDSACTEAIIRAALDRVLARPLPENIKHQADAKRVAIIGSGPSGLTAAWELARMGLPVTVFESLPEPGGMLRTGIPEYRLPKDVVDAEIGRIAALGVEMRTGAPVDQNAFHGLVNSGEFAAVLLATGASMSRKLRLEGEDSQGVIPALAFLKEYNLTGKADVGKNVVVIGGGNVATDAAGAALRCGAESVRLFCLEPEDSMPAHDWEIKEAAEDGVEINPAWGPRAILSDDGKVSGVEFIRCKSVLDQNGRFNPVFDESKSITAEADTVITAIGQAPDLAYLGGNVGVFRGAVRVDPYTMATSLTGVYAGGDAIMGTASLITAIEDGRMAAKSIQRYLGGWAQKLRVEN